jgi:hypothetical protein
MKLDQFTTTFGIDGRARRGGQLVDIAILTTFAAMVVWTLALQH